MQSTIDYKLYSFKKIAIIYIFGVQERYSAKVDMLAERIRHSSDMESAVLHLCGLTLVGVLETQKMPMFDRARPLSIRPPAVL